MPFGYRDLIQLLRLQHRRVRDRWSEFLGETPRAAMAPEPEIESTEITAALLDSHGMQGFFAVWQLACAKSGRSMPMRADIDIVELGTYIGELGLLEVIDGGRDFRYRVHSMGAAKLLGADYTGKLLSETDRPPERQERVRRRYARVVETKLPWYVRTPAPAELDIHYTARLMLPLSEDGASVSMIIFARQSGPRRRRRDPFH